MTAAMDLSNLDDWPLRTLQETRHQLVLLTQHPGWEVYKAFVNRSLAGRLNEAMAPATGIAEVLASEYNKGRYAGIVGPFQALSGWIDELNQAIAKKEPDNA